MSKESAMKAALAPGQQPETQSTQNPEGTQQAAQTQTTPAQNLDASRLAIFAKKEAKFRQEQEAFRLEREKWQQELELAKTTNQRVRDFEDLAKKDKIAALKQLGWSDTDIINAMNPENNEPSAEEIARKIAQEETQKIRDEQKQREEEAAKAQNEALITQLKTDIGSAIKANAEKFEFCNFEGAEAEAQAYQIIVENLRENGELLSVEEALEITEEYYEERAKAVLSGVKKLKPAPAAETTTASGAEPAGATTSRGANTGKPPVSNVPQKSKTLTNSVTATTTALASTTQNKRETPAEKRERLINEIKTRGLRR